MKRPGAFLIFAVLYFLAAMALLGLTQAGDPPSATAVIAAELGLFATVAWACFRRREPRVERDEGGRGGSRNADPEEWLQSGDGKLAVARVTAWACAMSPLLVLLHIRSVRRGAEQVAQVGLTAEEAGAMAASLLRMAEKVEATAPTTVQ